MGLFLAFEEVMEYEPSRDVSGFLSIALERSAHCAAWFGMIVVIYTQHFMK